MIVKPAEGLTVFDPVTARPLPPEGITIEAGNLHWSRLEMDGDVSIEPDAVAEQAPAPAEMAPAPKSAPAAQVSSSKGDSE